MHSTNGTNALKQVCIAKEDTRREGCAKQKLQRSAQAATSLEGMHIIITPQGGQKQFEGQSVKANKTKGGGEDQQR